ncbi:NAD(P)-dependent oxidoreductase [Pseudonocardia acaciae]|uniref:NAD(P)-dependent oxidoreductase n=1 Tax=Pseudonocardia acaciae TaxID=551276 RepID=UPI00048A7EBD|nr:NAD(P)-dependent oxidoreductase [Pseudonocardia acaciae]
MSGGLGFVGVGRMAGPMARRCVERGWHAHLLDPSPAATAPFRGTPSVTVHDRLDGLVAASEIVLLSLPTPEALREVCAELVDGGAEGRVVVSTSTAGVDATRAVAAELAAAGVSFVDAPVSGGVAGAERGTLTIIAAGVPDAVARCRPVFDAIGEAVFHVGAEPGQAQVMKVANNVLSLGALAAAAEATAVTAKAGIPLDVAVEVLNASSGRSSATAVKFPNHVLSGAFDFGFPAAGALKDVTLFDRLAAEMGIPAPLARAVVACWRRTVDDGYGDEDCTRIVTRYRRLAGLDDDAP